jgi:hypothetical protein
VVDVVQSILGDIRDPHMQFQNQRPELSRVDLNTGEIVGTVKSDVPDLVILMASMTGSETVHNGATLLVRYRKGPSFKGEPAFVWSINCEKGELRLVSPAGPALQLNVYSEQVTIEVHDFATDEMKPIEWNWADYQLELPEDARVTAAWYEAYAAGTEYEAATFQDALHRHEQLEKWLNIYN